MRGPIPRLPHRPYGRVNLPRHHQSPTLSPPSQIPYPLPVPSTLRSPSPARTPTWLSPARINPRPWPRTTTLDAPPFGTCSAKATTIWLARPRVLYDKAVRSPPFRLHIRPSEIVGPFVWFAPNRASLWDFRSSVSSCLCAIQIPGWRRLKPTVSLLWSLSNPTQSPSKPALKL
ncbi:uncharacterized protein MONBRDRAFT_38612, partial [Monosiga brevicollis MX1]